MQETPENPFTREVITSERLDAWREMVSLMARLVNVPVGLVMRVDGPKIEVFLSSATEGNPYAEGDSETYVGSGLYCEWVVQNEERLAVPDAHADPDWDANPDLKLGLPAYLGVPVRRPDGHVFGTLCVLDSKPNPHSDDALALVERFRDLMEKDLELIAAHARIHLLAEELSQQSVVPICMYCKSVRCDTGSWKQPEALLKGFTGKDLSHGICPTCYPSAERTFLDT